MKIYKLYCISTGREFIIGHYLHKETAEHDKRVFEKNTDRIAEIKEVNVCEDEIKEK